MECLDKLWLRYNKISVISPEIGRLKRLKMLDLRDNKILELPAEIGELSSLSIFLISGNHLKRLPDGCFTLAILIVLNCRGRKSQPVDTNGLAEQRASDTARKYRKIDKFEAIGDSIQSSRHYSCYLFQSGSA